MLRKHGADKIAKEYESHRVKSVYFQITTPAGSMPFTLPVNVDAVYQLLIQKKQAQRRYSYSMPKDVEIAVHDQAERTAWRIIAWWLKSQLALIQTQMVTVTEVFLPYMLVSKGQTLYQKLEAGEFTALMPARID